MNVVVCQYETILRVSERVCVCCVEGDYALKVYVGSFLILKGISQSNDLRCYGACVRPSVITYYYKHNEDVKLMVVFSAS